MKDYVLREKVLRCVEEDGKNCELDLGYYDHNVAFQEIIKDIPAADVVPVVRCRNCKYCSPGLTKEERSIPDADLVCAYWDSDGLNANDFCSYGERKGGDE